jgi:hypothetical protein
VYDLRFFFDAGSGVCLWAGNEAARARFGYPVPLTSLPLDDALLEEGQALVEAYDAALDWDDPAGPLRWSEDACRAFDMRVGAFVARLRAHLGPEFAVDLSGYRPLVVEI